jgi:integrase
MLTVSALRKAIAGPKARKLHDSAGLYVLLRPDGARYWRYDYRHAGKRKTLALGVYPAVDLPRARQLCTDARALLRRGIDPGAHRKATRVAASENTFEALAREFLEKKRGEQETSTNAKATNMLETWAFPWIGARPIADITPPEMLDSVLRRVEAAGKHETAQRLKQRCGQIFRYAIATGRATRDPTADLRGVLVTPKTKHLGAITDPARLRELLVAIDAFNGQFVTTCALKLSPLLFVRPGELRKAEWSEFSLDADYPEWRIPKSRMKMREEHIVPLSTQAAAILAQLKPLTGQGRHVRFVFPGARSRERPMSENAVTAALRRLGFEGSEMTAHGFRSTASTRLNEMGWSPDVIERQLAHGERNKVRAAYNRAQYISERRKMMQAWADYLDELRVKAQVVPIREVA